MAYDAAFIVVKEWGHTSPVIIGWETIEDARTSRDRCIENTVYWSRITIHKHTTSGLYETLETETKTNDKLPA